MSKSLRFLMCATAFVLGILCAYRLLIQRDNATDHANQLYQLQKEREAWQNQFYQAQKERDEYLNRLNQAQRERDGVQKGVLDGNQQGAQPGIDPRLIQPFMPRGEYLPQVANDGTYVQTITRGSEVTTVIRNAKGEIIYQERSNLVWVARDDCRFSCPAQVVPQYPQQFRAVVCRKLPTWACRK